MSKRSALKVAKLCASRLALSAVLAGAALCAAAGAARAQDVGERVEFPGGGLLSPAATPVNGIVYDSGRSSYLTMPWDTILLHGTSSNPTTTLEASRADAQGNWSAWQPVEVKRFSNGRFWAKAKLAPGPGQLRIRALDFSNPKATVEVFDIEVFTERPAQRVNGAALAPDFSQGGGTKPYIYSRAQWGAKPPKEPYTPDTYWRITLHHTDGLQTHALADSEQELRFIQDFHMNGRGWDDIAYHFLIDAEGRIFEGRPMGALGAHTLHNNEGNIGIALMATHQAPKNDPVTQKEYDALVSLGRYLVAHYNIDPATLKGHRDYKDTDCPGDLAYRLLPELRQRFAEPAPAPGQAAVAAAPKPKKRAARLPPIAKRPNLWD